MSYFVLRLSSGHTDRKKETRLTTLDLVSTLLAAVFSFNTRSCIPARQQLTRSSLIDGVEPLRHQPPFTLLFSGYTVQEALDASASSIQVCCSSTADSPQSPVAIVRIFLVLELSAVTASNVTVATRRSDMKKVADDIVLDVWEASTMGGK